MFASALLLGLVHTDLLTLLLIRRGISLPRPRSKISGGDRLATGASHALADLLVHVLFSGEAFSTS